MKKKLEVYCDYARQWIPLGRARTRCPRCGAVIGGGTHATRNEGTEGAKEKPHAD